MIVFSAGTVQQAWWSRTGSNRRHPACNAGALPAELRPLPAHGQHGRGVHGPAPAVRTPSRHSPNMVGLGGLEPPTSRLSSARSNQLSYKPVQTDTSQGLSRLAWLRPRFACLGSCFVAGFCRKTVTHFSATCFAPPRQCLARRPAPFPRSDGRRGSCRARAERRPQGRMARERKSKSSTKKEKRRRRIRSWYARRSDDLSAVLFFKRTERGLCPALKPFGKSGDPIRALP
jgi:hypothetical protein